MEDSQRKETGHGNVHQGVGAEAEATAGGKGAEKNGGGLLGLQETFGGGVGV